MATGRDGEELGGKAAFENWLATGGLYKRQEFSDAQGLAIADVLHNNGDTFGFDTYCPSCCQRSHFKSVILKRIRPIISAVPISSLGGGRRETVPEYFAGTVGPALREMRFCCARNEHHQMYFFLRAALSVQPLALVLTKIGQDPSSFDLLTPELERLGKLLNDQDRRELRSAELVASHGLHVAAFTYLRRVFERRVEFAHAAAKQDAGWDEAAYQTNIHRMDERIQALRAHLPPFLVEHRSAYGILSRGIHELSEDDCATGYAAMLDGVHLILEQESERRARTERETRLGATIAKFGQKLGNS